MSKTTNSEQPSKDWKQVKKELLKGNIKLRFYYYLGKLRFWE